MIPKIAIQGHPDKGEEIIEILKSLGGKNTILLEGNDNTCYYYINNDSKNTIYCHDSKHINECYKKYTLEQFKKEFPFKIKDEIIVPDYYNKKGTIIDIKPYGSIFSYYIKLETGNGIYRTAKYLKPYNEMKEERNITLSIEKAKEYYEKGGELKEIALQAFSEKELNPLPKTWEEFCDNYPIKESEAMIACDAKIIDCRGIQGKREYAFKDIMPSEKSAKAHLALMQLEQLRDCYRQGDIPDFNNPTNKYCIIKQMNDINITVTCYSNHFLSFTKKEVAEEYLTNFKPLIKIAEDYI